MCLILFAYQVHPRYPLVVLANRDEFFARPSQAAHFWPDTPSLLAGKDLEAGGTWLGMTRQGRFCAITNYREPLVEDAPADSGLAPVRSRGAITLDYLQGTSTPAAYLDQLREQSTVYRGFNLLLGQFARGSLQMFYYSNQQNSIRELTPGIYGLSNHLLDSPWPKVVNGKQALQHTLDSTPQNGLRTEQLLQILLDKQTVDDAQLPNTGVGLELERLLAPRFIQAEHYGTRASTVLVVDNEQQVEFCEQNFSARGKGEFNHFHFSIE